MSRRLARRGAVLALGLGLAACDAAGGAERGGEPTSDPDGPIRLVLVAEPLQGDAPLAVRFRASLEGELVDEVRFRCATAAFTLGDDSVQLVPPEPPCDGVQRAYETEHVYAAAGTFPASVRLIARPVQPSRAVQVLVRGPTPTPVPRAAVPGPTIVIATARPTRVALAAATATPVVPEPSPTAAAERPTTAPTARATPAPTGVAMADRTERTAVAVVPPATARPGGGTEDRAAPTAAPADLEASEEAVDARAVLPADLYFVAGPTDAQGSLAQLPAAGTLPQAVGGVDGVADDYAVSSLGLVAHVADGALGLITPLGVNRNLVRTDAARPVWSPDGRVLAYQRAGELWRFDVMAFRDERLAAEGAPVAFSRDGRWLLVLRDDGAPGIVRLDDGSARWLPLEGATAGGWLPDGAVLWLSGAGLRLVTVDDALLVTTLIEPSIATSAAFVRADRRMLVLAEDGDATRLFQVDLAAPLPRAEPAGAPLPLAVDADIAFAPDGRTLAVAGPAGVLLVDPATGAGVPLVDTPARRPTWHLARR